MNNQVQLENARKEEQIKVMEQIIKDGVCPFCEENLEKYHPRPILFKTKHWIVTENAWPYDMAKKHFLLIAKRHIENSRDLLMCEWADIGSLMKKLEKEHLLDHGTLLMRFGDMSKTGATVRHLHIQLVQSDPDHPEYDPGVGILTRVG
jgi:ATP adenylyltransferase